MHPRIDSALILHPRCVISMTGGHYMSRLKAMLRTHPAPAGHNGDAATECIEACFDCAEVCSICADACLAEQKGGELVQCIRLNQDCADICHVTGTLLARTGHRDANTLHLLLHACAQAARSCADECEKHAAHMEHCRLCAEACRRCAEACDEMVAELVP
jgi:hypothetical protein